MATALKMVSEDSPAARLAGLKATRTELLGRVAELTAARQRLGEAEETERAATAAIAELDAGEIAAASEWASTGAVGAAPAPDNHKHRELAECLASAQAAAAAARGAGAGLDAELAALRARIAEVDADIETATLDCLELERITTMNELAAVAGQAARLTARVRSHAICLGERGRHLRDSGDPGRAQQYFILAEALAGKPLPYLAPTVGDIDAARLQWQRRFGELKA